MAHVISVRDTSELPLMGEAAELTHVVHYKRSRRMVHAPIVKFIQDGKVMEPGAVQTLVLQGRGF